LPTGIGYDDELTLLQKFQNVIIVHQSLKPAYQAVISDICHRMADGMCDFAERKVQTVADYDLYCHYVAGLVGIGLSRIFSQSGLEAPGVGANEHMSNSMGLFLQKTNIIRDYLEDYVDERSFWPPEVWKNYASELGQLREDSIRSTKGLACLNHLIANAMEHVPDVLSYMSAIHNPQVFSFCAIPQVMAIATLAELYDNEKVFKGVVKIRKGLSARLMLNVGDMRSLKAWFRVFASQMRYKLRSSDASSKRIASLLDGIDAATADVADDTICQTNIVTPQWCAFRAATSVAIATFAACVGALFAHRRDRNALTFYADALGGMSEHTFVRLVYMLLVLSTVYLFAFVGVHVVPRKQAKTEPAVTEAKKEQKKQSSKSNLTATVQRA
jgi:farnesyl-diphosphate farnesyltransferase